ncbi:hypothetical protein DBV15_11017 [Temnothorax longispinosus]|uniref:Uncharacterized protein n=1 Tax=Temnothorax longispinosus TaxID=300112 RepID=A0A4S2KU58_9HYME|nr:hypothetical protein DBV15_11017 [Temnothorax longispinosus]
MEIGSVTYLIVTTTEAEHRKRVGDDGREWSWVPGERWKWRWRRGGGGGGSGLARTPGGVDGVAPASTRILWTYQAILIVSSGCKPADLIILGVPGPRRNERAIAFPGVDSVIGSNSGLA